jgi:hypothetical protein
MFIFVAALAVHYEPQKAEQGQWRDKRLKYSMLNRFSDFGYRFIAKLRQFGLIKIDPRQN